MQKNFLCVTYTTLTTLKNQRERERERESKGREMFNILCYVNAKLGKYTD